MSAPANGMQMPPLDGATEWIGSPALDREHLRGHVVVVNFWTLTCINWLRTEPYVRAWSNAYRDDGLIVLGVHTPEFSFEHDPNGVRAATAARGISYPVAVDNDYAIWRAFENHYWPALYFVDRDGAIRDQHFGEGRYERSEQLIEELLGVERPPVEVAGEGIEAEADWEHLRTPETYLGYGRGERFASAEPPARDEPRRYSPRASLEENEWALDGEWVIGPENVALAGGAGAISFAFHARDAHLVMATAAPEPIPFRVTLDGAPPGASRGGDVDGQGNGALREGRLYQLVRQDGPVQGAVLEIAFDAPGAEAYAFTFG